MKKKILISIVILILFVVIFFIIYQLKKGSEEISSLPIDYNQNEENEEQKEQISQIKENQGLTADENIYEIKKEYDGRETVTIKDSIQYKVALAGIIKKETPKFSEIDELLNRAPKSTGIWISENSKEQFLTFLNKITKANYVINDEGFLVQEEVAFMNKYDKKIKKMLSNKVLYVFDVSSITYLVDEVTGEIGEYPFEEMDPYTSWEFFEDENKQMYIISENKIGKINKEDALKEILEGI